MEKKSEEEQRASQEQNKKKGIIKIPSYQEVFGGGTSSSSAPQPYNPPPPPSFSQAFSFIKASEFYTPPPTSDPSPRHVAAEPQPSAAPPPPPTTASSSSGSAPSSFYSSAIASAQNRNAILVSHRQKGNPLLKHIRNVRWTFADVFCDYLLGQSACALYISLRYHLLHPDYLYYRIRELQKNFKLRVVLCHVDVEDVVKPLLEVTRTAMLHDCTLLCGWRCSRRLSEERKPLNTSTIPKQGGFTKATPRRAPAIARGSRASASPMSSTVLLILAHSFSWNYVNVILMLILVYWSPRK